MWGALWDWKPCETPGCTHFVDFRWGWDHIPNFCPYCKSKFARLVPVDWEFALCDGFPKIEDDAFVIEFHGKGTGGKNYRVSWRSNEAEAHWIDLGIENEQDPLYYRDPRPAGQHKCGRKE